MKLTEYSHKTLLEHSREQVPFRPEPSPGLEELRALQETLEASAPVPPLPAEVRARILKAGQTARYRRKPWQALAAAAAVALLLSFPSFRSSDSPAPPDNSVATAPVHEPNPLAQDFLLSELDLLDLQLQELQETAWFDHNLLFAEDSI